LQNFTKKIRRKNNSTLAAGSIRESVYIIYFQANPALSESFLE
jgi:hypothetical protein